jgi:hypothetical protein
LAGRADYSNDKGVSFYLKSIISDRKAPVKRNFEKKKEFFMNFSELEIK